MTHRQILRQLAEAGQTMTLTDKGRHRVAPKRTTTKVAKPLHPLTPLRRNYPVGTARAAEQARLLRRRRTTPARGRGMNGAPRTATNRLVQPGSRAPEELRELARLLSAPLRHDDGTEWTADDYFRSHLRSHLDEPEGSLLPADQAADREPSGTGTATGWTTTASSSRSA
jgi:hypothetical protein